MEKMINDNVVVPEKYMKMTKEELHAEIRRLEEKNGFTSQQTVSSSYPKPETFVISKKLGSAV